MKHKFILWKLYCLKSREQGFSLTLAIMFGLLFVLGAFAVLGTAFKSESKQSADELISGSEAIASLAIAEYQNVINNNRAMAFFGPCGDTDGVPGPDWDTNGVCTSSAESWHNPSSGSTGILTKGILTKGLNVVDHDNNPATAPIVPISSIPICSEIGDYTTSKYTTASTAMGSLANQSWNTVTSPAGTIEYRLVEFNPGPPEAELTVEARVAGGANTSESIGTSVSRYKATFPTNSKPFYGLWINRPQELQINQARIQSEIYDSGCANDLTEAGTIAGLVKQAKGIQLFEWGASVLDAGLDADYQGTYLSIPETTMPPLPTAPSLPIGSRLDGVELNGSTVLTLTGSSGSGTVYHYRDDLPGGDSLKITENAKVVASGGGTVKLVLEGNLVLGPSLSGIYVNRIEVAVGTKLIIYAKKNIEFSGDAEIENLNRDPAKLQIYGYGTGSEKIELTGTSKLNSVFLLAPDVPLMPGGQTRITGTAWVRTWIDDGTTNPLYTPGGGYTTGGSPVFSKEEPSSFSDLEISSTTTEAEVSFNEVGEVTSLARCDVGTGVCN